ncbi:MAG: hypothetical protein EA383_09475 [Spirochaetaceae bacterium]|nr:MAG: hypothetical protein EA383_09475 [Spirochaetaceae bacterium]
MKTTATQDTLYLVAAATCAGVLGLVAATGSSLFTAAGSGLAEPGMGEGLIRALSGVLTGGMRDLARRPGPFLSLVVISVGFLYGLLHGAMPGHRKAVLVSYFAGRDVRPVDALSTGMLLGVLHCLLASVIVLGAWQLLTVSFGEGVEWTSLLLERAAAVVLVLVGLWLLLRKPAGGHNATRIQDRTPASRSLSISDFQNAPKRLQYGDRRGRRALLLGAIIPCPGSSLLMIFAVSIGAPIAGLLAVSGMAVGMGLTMALFALSSVLLRRSILHRLSPTTLLKTHRVLDRATAVFILSFGAGILVVG